jgi:hypothetical protein
VLDAVALEDLDRAVVALDREVDGPLALGDAQHGAQPRVEGKMVGGRIELGERRGKGVGSGGSRGPLRGCEHRGGSPGGVVDRPVKPPRCTRTSPWTRMNRT